MESDYPFPRVIAMQGDGKTSYDVSKDGVPTMIGECAVRVDVFGMSLRVLTSGTGRLSPHQHSDEAQGYYVKDTVLDVCQPVLSRFNPHF